MEPNYMDKFEPDNSVKNQFTDFIQTFAILAAIFLVIFLFVAQPHRVSGLSMYPTFNDADYIITDKLTYRFSLPQRGDIVVFQNPRDHGTDFIKRVIGLPGEKVKVEDGKVFVNNKALSEAYLSSDIQTIGSSFLPSGQEITVPVGEYFVMGDNRLHSSDSREWGYIKKSEILGRVLVRYWPPNELGILPGAYAAYNF